MPLPGNPGAPVLTPVSAQDISLTTPSMPAGATQLGFYHKWEGDVWVGPAFAAPNSTYPLAAPSTITGNQKVSCYLVASNDDGTVSGSVGSAVSLSASPPPIVLSVDSADGTAITIRAFKPPWSLGFGGQFDLIWSAPGSGSDAFGFLGGADHVDVQVINLTAGLTYQLVLQTYDALDIFGGSLPGHYTVLPHEGAPPFPTCN